MDSRRFALAGVMGWPVAHSRSPLIHQHWIAHHGLNGAYVRLPVDPAHLQAALEGLAPLGFAGCNLTIPHKVAALHLVQRVDPAARRIGAINTIVVEPDGSLSGSNTDGTGFIRSLQERRSDWQADAGPITVLGAGGGARAVLLSLAEHGAREIRVCNRSFDKARALALEFGAPLHALPWEQRHDALDGVALLVNTTNQGMTGQPALDIALDRLPLHALVSDIVYVPLETPLLAAARRRGNSVVDGLGMLINQARPAFHAWFGVMPAVDAALRRKVEATL